MTDLDCHISHVLAEGRVPDGVPFESSRSDRALRESEQHLEQAWSRARTSLEVSLAREAALAQAPMAPSNSPLMVPPYEVPPTQKALKSVLPWGPRTAATPRKSDFLSDAIKAINSRTTKPLILHAPMKCPEAGAIIPPFHGSMTDTRRAVCSTSLVMVDGIPYLQTPAMLIILFNGFLYPGYHASHSESAVVLRNYLSYKLSLRAGFLPSALNGCTDFSSELRRPSSKGCGAASMG